MVNRAYVPNVQPVQVPQTHLTQRVVTQQTPVQVMRYVDELVTQQVPVQVQRVEYDEQVRQVPVTVQRPQTERVAYKVPVQTVRYEEVESVRKVPVVTQRMQYEEKEEPVQVRVMKVVTETRTEKFPVTQLKQVPYSFMRYTPRTVAMMVPVDSFGGWSNRGVIVGPVIEQPSILTETQKIEVREKHNMELKKPDTTITEKPAASEKTKAPRLLEMEKVPALDADELDAPKLELRKPSNQLEPQKLDDRSA